MKTIILLFSIGITTAGFAGKTAYFSHSTPDAIQSILSSDCGQRLENSTNFQGLSKSYLIERIGNRVKAGQFNELTAYFNGSDEVVSIDCYAGEQQADDAKSESHTHYLDNGYNVNVTPKAIF